MVNTIYLKFEDGSWKFDYIPCSFCHSDTDYWIERYEDMYHCKIIDYEIEE